MKWDSAEGGPSLRKLQPRASRKGIHDKFRFLHARGRTLETDLRSHHLTQPLPTERTWLHVILALNRSCQSNPLRAVEKERSLSI